MMSPASGEAGEGDNRSSRGGAAATAAIFSSSSSSNAAAAVGPDEEDAELQEAIRLSVFEYHHRQQEEHQLQPQQGHAQQAQQQRWVTAHQQQQQQQLSMEQQQQQQLMMRTSSGCAAPIAALADAAPFDDEDDALQRAIQESLLNSRTSGVASEQLVSPLLSQRHAVVVEAEAAASSDKFCCCDERTKVAPAAASATTITAGGEWSPLTSSGKNNKDGTDFVPSAVALGVKEEIAASPPAPPPPSHTTGSGGGADFVTTGGGCGGRCVLARATADSPGGDAEDETASQQSSSRNSVMEDEEEDWLALGRSSSSSSCRCEQQQQQPCTSTSDQYHHHQHHQRNEHQEGVHHTQQPVHSRCSSSSCKSRKSSRCEAEDLSEWLLPPARVAAALKTREARGIGRTSSKAVSDRFCPPCAWTCQEDEEKEKEDESGFFCRSSPLLPMGGARQHFPACETAASPPTFFGALQQAEDAPSGGGDAGEGAAAKRKGGSRRASTLSTITAAAADVGAGGGVVVAEAGAAAAAALADGVAGSKKESRRRTSSNSCVQQQALLAQLQQVEDEDTMRALLRVVFGKEGSTRAIGVHDICRWFHHEFLFGRNEDVLDCLMKKQGGSGDEKESTRDRDSRCFWGLVQLHGGPCGLLAAVQCFLLRALFFSPVRAQRYTELFEKRTKKGQTEWWCSSSGSSRETRQDAMERGRESDQREALPEACAASFFLAPSELAREHALVEALTAILYQSTETSRYYVAYAYPLPFSSAGPAQATTASPSAVSVCSHRNTPSGAAAADAAAPVFSQENAGVNVDVKRLEEAKKTGLLEKVRVFVQSFNRISDVMLFYWRHYSALLLAKTALISFLFSVVLTRGVQKVMEDMDSPDHALIGVYGHCSQELVNLLLLGAATSNVWDGDKKLGASETESEKVLLGGVRKRPLVGFLTEMEALRYCEVGSRYKNPLFPLWVVGSGNHYTTLFSRDRFVAALSTQSLALMEAQAAFKTLDQENNMYILSDQFPALLALLGHKDKEVEAQHATGAADGVVLWSEFLPWYTKLVASIRGPAGEGEPPKKFTVYLYDGQTPPGPIVRRFAVELHDIDEKYAQSDAIEIARLLWTRWPAAAVKEVPLLNLEM